MTRADGVLCVAAALAGAGLGVYPWLLTGGFETSSPELIWAWNWLTGALALFVALVVAGRPAALLTAVAFALLSLFAYGLGITLARSPFGPSVDDGSTLAQLGASIVAVLVARYAATRDGPLPASGRGLLAAIGGGVVGFGLAWLTGGAWATILVRIIPCSGFECGMGTAILGYLLILAIGLVGGVGLGLQLARGPRPERVDA
jgi:hypothetical protein